MGFVANTPTETEEDILNTEFYPDISPADCREVIRVDSNITPERLRASLVNAITLVNSQLSEWKLEQLAEGNTTLENVPAEVIDSTSANVHHYTRAVYHYAKAELSEHYRDYDTTLNASQRAEALEESIDDYRRTAILSVRSILGLSSSTVELI